MSSQTINNNESTHKLVLAIPLVLGMIVIGLYVAGIVVQSVSSESVSWRVASAFFFIPLALEAVALFFLWKRVNLCYYFFSLAVTTLCLGSCYCFWLVYSNYKWFEVDTLQYLSLVVLFIILILIVGVGVMTYAITRPSSNHFGGAFCTQLNHGVRSHPFWAITFFFTLFIGVAYLFGFSLAFHDKYAIQKTTTKVVHDQGLANVHQRDSNRDLRPALRIDDHKSIDDWPAEKGWSNDHTVTTTPATFETLPAAKNLTSPVSEKSNRFAFYFDSNEADLKTEKMEKCEEGSPPQRSWVRNASEFTSNDRANDCNLRAIVKKIKDHTANGKKIRITLIGHSDNEPVGPQYNSATRQNNSVRRQTQASVNATPVFRYVSNYELSNARAEHVKHRILQMFPVDGKPQNIDWLILPASNEEIREIPVGLIDQTVFEPKDLESKFTQDQIVTGISPDQLIEKFGEDGIKKMYLKMGSDRSAEENRVVLAAIEFVSDHNELRTLGLIDYMYFSIYTITTTGYGDIKPTTAYAKFVTSIANFCEVLFLVVFFNALVSLRPNRPDHPDTNQVQPAMPAGPQPEVDGINTEATGPRVLRSA